MADPGDRLGEFGFPVLHRDTHEDVACADGVAPFDQNLDDTATGFGPHRDPPHRFRAPAQHDFAGSLGGHKFADSDVHGVVGDCDAERRSRVVDGGTRFFFTELAR